MLYIFRLPEIVNRESLKALPFWYLTRLKDRQVLCAWLETIFPGTTLNLSRLDYELGEYLFRNYRDQTEYLSAVFGQNKNVEIKQIESGVLGFYVINSRQSRYLESNSRLAKRDRVLRLSK